ncbi:MAG: hypothetical protein IPK78_19160 [Rhodospirillales bacterium]|nr:hypothetical protein [Rhodospirillales bacterium]
MLERSEFCATPGDAPAAGDVAALPPSAALIGLLEAQEVDVAGSAVGRRLAARRGAALLDRLEELRINILEGKLTPQRLLGLASAVREQRQHADEGALNTVLDEIELRVEVEIAKLALASTSLSQTPLDPQSAANFADKINGLPPS